MNNPKEKNVGFEVWSESDDHIVYKKVLSAKIPKKEREKREMQSARVTVSYFDKDDIERLRDLQIQIANNYVVKRAGELVIFFNAIKRFLTK